MPQLKINDQDVFVFYEPAGPEGKINWRWRVGERCGSANSEAEALFWAGWWTGRRMLVEEMAAKVGSVPSEINGGGPTDDRLPGQC